VFVSFHDFFTSLVALLERRTAAGPHLDLTRWLDKCTRREGEKERKERIERTLQLPGKMAVARLLQLQDEYTA
jgi:hypothetical protein